MSKIQIDTFKSFVTDVIHEVVCSSAGVAAKLDCMYSKNEKEAVKKTDLIIAALTSYLKTINNHLLKISPKHALNLDSEPMIENMKGGGVTNIVPYSKSQLSVRGKKGTSLSIALLSQQAIKLIEEDRYNDFLEIHQVIANLEEQENQMQAFVIYNSVFVATVVGFPFGAAIGWCMFQFLKAPITISSGVANTGKQAVINSVTGLFNTVQGFFGSVESTEPAPSLVSAAKAGAEAANALIDAQIPQDLLIAMLGMSAIICFILVFIYISYRNERVAKSRRNFLEGTTAKISNATRRLRNMNAEAAKTKAKANANAQTRRKNLRVLGLSDNPNPSRKNIVDAYKVFALKARNVKATDANRENDRKATEAKTRLLNSFQTPNTP